MLKPAALFAISFVVLLMVVTTGCTDSAPAKKTIGVSLLTRADDFFKDLENGLEEEAAKHGYKLLVQSAEKNAATQTQQIEDFCTRGVDAIVLCPCDSDTVAQALRVAEEKGVPVFTADIAAKGANVVSHIASNNHAGGVLAGKALAARLGGQGEVIIIDHPTVSSVQDRTRGFKEAIAEHPGITIVAEPAADGRMSVAQSQMEDALVAHPNLKGVFGINDSTALGALQAVEAAGRSDIFIVGYDANPQAREAILRGSALVADVVQYPDQIGVMTIRTIVDHFAGQDVPKLQPVDVGIVDKASLTADSAGSDSK